MPDLATALVGAPGHGATPPWPGTALPARDDARLRALSRYAILDTPAHFLYDDVVTLARTVTGSPAAGLAFLDRDRLWFKSVQGLDVQECSPDAFRARTGAEGWHGGGAGPVQAVLAVPVPHGDRLLSAVATAPCTTRDGYLLGYLFVLDERPDGFTDRELTALGALAHQAVVALELRRTLMAYHTVVDGSGRVVFHADQDNRLVCVTPTWSALTGYGAVRSLGVRLQDVVHPDDRDRFVADLAASAAREDAQPLECRIRQLDGSDVPVEVVVRPWTDETGRRWGVIGFIADIADRKAREIEVRHAQRLEGLGRLAAGIAHEINTPIQFVGDNTRFLAESCEAMLTLIQAYRSALDTGAQATSWAERQAILAAAEEAADVDYLVAEVPSAVTQSLEGVDRVASLVRAMKTFSHPGLGAAAPADLDEALLATLTVARSQIRAVADVSLDLGSLPMVECHVADLNQVFLNMVINAADAIEETGTRGTITITTRTDGDDAVITIADTGGGIPDEIQRKIFDPFFTTKDVGRGTGQGLALARAVVVDAHQGTISVVSRPGDGATFTLRLPLAGPAPAPSTDAPTTETGSPR